MFSISIGLTVRNASNEVFTSTELITLSAKQFDFSGSITRTVTSTELIYNTFDRVKGYSIPRNGYVCELQALGVTVNNFVLNVSASNGTEFTVRVSLKAMGKHSVSIIISASANDAVSRAIKDSVGPYITDKVINQARVRAIAAGRQASSELLGAKLPSRVKTHEDLT